MNRDGKSTPLRTTPARWLNPRFRTGWPPAGVRRVRRHTARRVDVRLVPRRAVTPDVRPGRQHQPVWTPDGRRIVFGSIAPRSAAESLLAARGRHRRNPAPDGQRPPADRGIVAPRRKDSRVHGVRHANAAPTVMLLRLEGDEASGWRPAQPTRLHEGRRRSDVLARRPMAGVRGEGARARAIGGVTFSRSRVRAAAGRSRPTAATIPRGRRHDGSCSTPRPIIGSWRSRTRSSGDSFHADKPQLLPNSHFVAARRRSKF